MLVAQSSWLSPYTKLNGSRLAIRSSDVIPRYETTARTAAHRFAWLTATPLGWPVEPDV